MRNRRVILLLGALAVAGNLAAQVQVEQVEVKKEGRRVAVGFSVPGAPEDMRSRQKMVLRPYLYAGGVDVGGFGRDGEGGYAGVCRRGGV